MIQPATRAHLEEIKKLTESCALALQKKGIFQWNEHYPSLETLSIDIEKQELFIFSEEEKIKAIVVLSSEMDEVYKTVTWNINTGKNLYVHRLAVLPDFWGMGLGQKMMDFVEDFARKNKYDSVRLDTFSQNKRNQRFYESRGYQKLEDIYFPMQSENPFYCYELPI